jgi:hypothetical protein
MERSGQRVPRRRVTISSTGRCSGGGTVHRPARPEGMVAGAARAKPPATTPSELPFDQTKTDE